MSIVWRKVLRDLWRNKARTFLVVLSIAVGVFAVGLIFGTNNLMRVRMTEDYGATRPAPILIWGVPFDQEVVHAVLREPAVTDAEIHVQTSFRWKLEGETDWRDGSLIARADYEAQRIGLIDLLDGHWPERRALAVERKSSQHFGIPLGTSVIVEYGRREIRLPVTGIVRDLDIQPPRFGGPARFYATPETVLSLTGAHHGRMDVLTTSSNSEDRGELARQIWDRLRAMQVHTNGYGTRDPYEHWAQEGVDTAFVILMALGALSLGMSTFLIINTTNAILVQQIWQIGVMKVVGASTGRIARIYLATALIYGGLALLLAVPVATAGAHFLARWILDELNFAADSFRATPLTVGLQAGVGLVVPFLAALVPVIGGAHTTPHRAISTYGLGGAFGKSLLDRLIGRIRSLSRPMSLSLRNTFRRKARIVLTLFTLALGGMTFIMVLSVNASFDDTVERLLQDQGYDVQMYFARSHLIERLVGVAESVPGVTTAEVWLGRIGISVKRGENERGSHIGLWGLPPDSQIFQPRLVDGRGLLPGDDHAILISNLIAVRESIQVGDKITIAFPDRDTSWTVVGIILNLSYGQRDCFVPYHALAKEFGIVNRGWAIMVQSEQHDGESQQALIQVLREAYGARNIEVSFSESASKVRETNRSSFDIIAYLLLTMAALAAIVGSIGLMGTMSINVLERGREIGVMRAIGASSGAVVRIVVAEGVLLGLLSWALALPLSYPGARLFGQMIGETLLNVGLYFSYPISSIVLWLAIVVALSALASLWPGLRATKVSVREALAYE